jgi:phage-related baseplate assembly protein
MAFNDLKFAEDDARVLAETLKDFYEAVRRASGEPGYRLALADPERLVQLAEAAILAQVNHSIDAAGKGSLLYFATPETIEHIGYMFGERGAKLKASFALTTIRYGLSVEQTVVTPIPKGWRTTPNNKVFFATMKTIEIPAGELYGDVEAICLTPGMAGMGFKAGEIKNMVDRSPFVASAVNLTPTSGGADIEEHENYRERLRMLPESFSTAGPDGAYEFWARTANPGIVDAKAYMPELDMGSFAEFLAPWGITNAAGFYTALFNYFRTSGTGPGNVDIACLMLDGELPSQEVKDQVYAVLSPKDRRPLTDFVHVKEPTPVEYSVDLEYWISEENATMAGSIIDSVDAAVQRFIKYQKSKLGLDIVPDLLRKMIMDCGVKRMEIHAPIFTVLKPIEVGIHNGEISVAYRGLEEA